MKSAARKSRSRVKRLNRSFFQRPAEDVARALIGKILVRRMAGKLFRARLIETEAYLGPDDLASHASKGRTPRTEVLFGPPGRAYVYLIYGLHEMLNVVAGAVGQGQGVLIRAADPLDDWQAESHGPGRLTRPLQITRLQNGLDVTGTVLHFLDNPDDRPAVQSTKRIGIDYASTGRMRRFASLTQIGRRANNDETAAIRQARSEAQLTEAALARNSQVHQDRTPCRSFRRISDAVRIVAPFKSLPPKFRYYRYRRTAGPTKGGDSRSRAGRASHRHATHSEVRPPRRDSSGGLRLFGNRLG